MAYDFDFLPGTWNVHNRRLVERHVGSDKWDEFDAVHRAHSFFGGAGSFDEIEFPTKGYSGATMRLFEPTSQEWSIYWSDSRRCVLDPPVVGRFDDGVGTFYGDDHDGDIPIRVRFIWSDMSDAGWHWEQAFSTDNEQTWETNWIMDATRRPDN